MSDFEQRQALENVLSQLPAGAVDASKKTVAAIQRQFPEDAEGLALALVALSTYTTLVIADITEANPDMGTVH